MTQATLTLTGFLLARIAEDEEKARRTRFGATDRPWVMVLPPRIQAVNGNFAPDHLRVMGRRAIAECEAKRAIVAEHGPVVNPLTPDITYCRMCVSDAGFGATSKTEDTGQVEPCRTLRLLALPYADHPHYRDEWRP